MNTGARRLRRCADLRCPTRVLRLSAVTIRRSRMTGLGEHCGPRGSTERAEHRRLRRALHTPLAPTPSRGITHLAPAAVHGEITGSSRAGVGAPTARALAASRRRRRRESIHRTDGQAQLPETEPRSFGAEAAHPAHRRRLETRLVPSLDQLEDRECVQEPDERQLGSGRSTMKRSPTRRARRAC